MSCKPKKTMLKNKSQLYVARHRRVWIAVTAKNKSDAYDKLYNYLIKEKLYNDEYLRDAVGIPQGLEEIIEWIDLEKEKDDILIMFLK